MIGCGGAIGLFAAWLKTKYGVSPLWFIGAATALGLLFTVLVTLLLLRTRPRVIFALDWVVSFESLVLVSVLSVFGIVILASTLVSSPAILLLIASILIAGVISLIVYLLENAPKNNWNHSEQIVEGEQR